MWGSDANGNQGVKGIMFPNKEAWIIHRILGMRRPHEPTGRFYPLATAIQTIMD